MLPCTLTQRKLFSKLSARLVVSRSHGLVCFPLLFCSHSAALILWFSHLIASFSSVGHVLARPPLFRWIGLPSLPLCLWIELSQFPRIPPIQNSPTSYARHSLVSYPFVGHAPTFILEHSFQLRSMIARGPPWPCFDLWGPGGSAP